MLRGSSRSPNPPAPPPPPQLQISMEKCEQNRKISPGRPGGSAAAGTTAPRRHLFSSILNFSVAQGLKVNGNNSPSTTQVPPTNPGNTKSKAEALKRKTKEDEDKILSPVKVDLNPLNGARSNKPQNTDNTFGQGPKTFSVLTALSELDIRKEEGENIHSRSTGALNPSTPSPRHPPASLGLGPARSQEYLLDEESHRSRILDDGSLSSHPHPRKAHSLAPRPKPRSVSEKNIHVASMKGTARRSKSRERTPDWIWKIFHLAKRGELDKLKASLVDMDSTLIRHLADAKGNTLLHCAARGGHLLTLQWLVSILGSQTEAALNDQNRAGRTVILTTLKSGQLECFQWMVLDTSLGDKGLVPTDGKWSLLHFASKYGNEGAVRWLCEQLHQRQVRVDFRDAAGVTPLHVAAKTGHIGVSQELIRAGADPLCQTELGWKPSDLALRHHHKECANYFIMAEAAGSLAKELDSILVDFATLHNHQVASRTHFREVLRVAKWLMKEREDLIKKFLPSGGNSLSSGGLLLGATLNGVRLSELEHCLVLAEAGWKRGETESNLIIGRETDLTNQNMTTTHLLQSRLFALHARQDKAVAAGGGMMCAASSDEDSGSSQSTVTSGDEESSIDLRLFPPCIRTKGGKLPGVILNSRSQHHRTSNSPWLLGSDDLILSALSPPRNVNGSTSQHLPNLDLLSTGSTSTASLLAARAGRHSSSSENSPGPQQRMSKVFGTTVENGQPSHRNLNTVPTAAVLEVIEPLHSSTKQFGCRGSPMSTKGPLKNSPLSQSPSISPAVLDPSRISSSSIESKFQIVENVRRRSKLLREDDTESKLPSPYATLLKNEFEEIYLTPDLIRGTHHSGNVVSVPPTQRLEPPHLASPEIYSDFEVSHFPPVQSRKSHSPDGSLAVGPKGGNFTPSPISSTLFGSEGRFSSDPISVPSSVLFPPPVPLSQSPFVSISPSSARKTYSGPLTILPLPSSPPAPAQQLPPPSVEAPAHLPNDSSSSCSEPMPHRPHSSASTVVFGFPAKTEWPGGGGGEDSPTPSENSRTESALPPPIPQSQSSASDTSKTEEGSVTLTELKNSAEDEGDIRQGEERLKKGDVDNNKDVGGNFERGENSHRGSKTRSPGLEASPSIIRNRLSTPIHKTPIHHRVKKAARGVVKKPWYEIEGSDDEEILLRVRRARPRSTCHSTSSSLSAPDESGSEDSCEDGQGPCDSTNCSRHNSMEFV